MLEAEIVPGILPEAIYWDLREPYNYFRVDRSEKHDRIFLGGEDQSTEDSSAGEMRFKGLADFLGNILLRETPTIRRKWSGEILETADGLPYIGETANKGIYIATGFAGNGMTYGALSSSAISGSILGRPEPWAEIYRLNR